MTRRSCRGPLKNLELETKYFILYECLKQKPKNITIMFACVNTYYDIYYYDVQHIIIK
jgi:hypothetical protein